MTGGTEGLAAWPPAAIAIVVGALLTLVGTGTATIWSLVRWRRDQRSAERAHVWQQAVWMAEMVASDDVGKSEIGRMVARAMYDMQIDGRIDDPGAIVLVRTLGKEERDATDVHAHDG
ncbi:hypothetical protein [Curtobacterium sp. PhB115]|uniref:hypothetical protein n=1 Tax=Curtobacterium sp. PhB115 TaxID=2485173 RepID=UPI000F4B54B0|nr:hypothetical protein [Curtobacterium sp. PhB115]ROP65558.1 hypothetical protein EDF19_2603 [Curtobacterium sp. PhB115]